MNTPQDDAAFTHLDRTQGNPSELSRHSPATVTARAPGKVNLSLRVGGLDESGYHPLINVFQAVSAWEEIVASARRDDNIVLTVQGPGARFVPLNETNLVAKAARALQKHTGTHFGASIHINKGVPVAGGMAGGSADAAATLVALNALWRLDLSETDLMTIGATLGADVPFSLFGGTAVGYGRGDELVRITDAGTYHWVFALRAKGLSTPAVFSRFDELTPQGAALNECDNERLYAALAAGDATSLGKLLHNDLQIPALDMAPDLRQTIETAHDCGALGVLVSGSGPTIAVLARDAEHAVTVRNELLNAQVCQDALVAQGSVPGAHLV
ncbi:4-(cytidine 5'-diphospho)-2-C-methyl-D-erythritol kinase [Timonella sp. A28]|uniref:4-(cytidine 5'-diphospho)-2-C-methyl-D-erythritol kinase n=1 Tax=Timonella sp. A28 TaxID=3442640 RepID=UPI003EBBD59B